MRSILALVLIVPLLTAAAHAETPKPPASAPAAAPVKCAANPAESDAKITYEKALRLQLDGKNVEAKKFYQRIITEYPKTSYAAAAREKLALIDARLRPTIEPKGIEGSGRVEVIMGDSLLWLSYGMMIPLLFTDQSEEVSRSFLWAGLGAGVAAGLTATLTTHDKSIPEGWASLHLFSQVWGSWNSFAIYLLTRGNPFDDELSSRWSSAGIAGSVIGGAALGLGASLLFKDQLALPRGQAEFISSAAAWGSIIGLSAVLLASGDDIRLRPAIGAVLGAGDGTLLLSSFLAPRWSKTRVRLTNLIGFGGVALGDAIALSAKLRDVRAYGGISLACTLVGLAAGYLATSGMPDDRTAAELQTLAPPALLTYDGSFDLGVPVPRLITSSTRTGKPSLGLSADLFAAAF
jgi:hypothetical protein